MSGISKLSEVGSDGRTSLPVLVTEASRQLSVCNSCRYCEGFCAVYPALSRRTELLPGDITQLANLCHDCRACFDACMYSEPHEFAINVPRILSGVRLEGYQRFVWPARVPALLRGWYGIFSGAAASVLACLVVALIHVGPSGLAGSGESARSPYQLIPYPALLVMVLLPAGYSAAVIALACRRFWLATGGPGRRPSVAAVGRATWYAATLRYLRGGGEDCYYPDDTKPSAARRAFHGLLMYGFLLCVVSTAAAAVEQDLLGIAPPYPYLSVPVLSGAAGGLAVLAGCVGLIDLKRRSSPVTSLAAMTVKDYGALVALAYLAASGLATLLLRTTPAFGLVFLAHLAAILLCFASIAYSKMMHVFFRYLALVQDGLEGESLVSHGRPTRKITPSP
jgi:citrate/tricarballylate utilization protein